MLLCVFLALRPAVASAASIEKVSKDRKRLVLKFDRQEVRDLYLGDLISIRFRDTYAVVVIAIVDKKPKQVLAHFVSGDAVDQLIIGAEFDVVEDSRLPSYNVWQDGPHELYFSESEELYTRADIGYRSVTVDGSTRESHTAYNLKAGGHVRTGRYAGLGATVDATNSSVNFAEAGLNGSYSQRRVDIDAAVDLTKRMAFGMNYRIMTGSFDLLIGDNLATASFTSSQIGFSLGQYGLNDGWSLYHRSKGSLRLRVGETASSAKYSDRVGLSDYYGWRYWKNREREVAYVTTVGYYPFDNRHGVNKPGYLERIELEWGVENFVTEHSSFTTSIFKTVPYQPDQFGFLRDVAAVGGNLGINNTLSKQSFFLAGLRFEYGLDEQEYGGTQTKITDLLLSIYGQFNYRL